MFGATEEKNNEKVLLVTVLHNKMSHTQAPLPLADSNLKCKHPRLLESVLHSLLACSLIGPCCREPCNCKVGDPDAVCGPRGRCFSCGHAGEFQLSLFQKRDWERFGAVEVVTVNNHFHLLHRSRETALCDPRSGFLHQHCRASTVSPGLGSSRLGNPSHLTVITC